MEYRLIQALRVLLLLLLDGLQGRKYQNGHASMLAHLQQAKLAPTATGGDERVWDSSRWWKAASSQHHRSLSLTLLPTSEACLTLQFYPCCWEAMKQPYM